MTCMMILTTRAVTTECLEVELSLSVEVDDSDCGSGGGDVVVGGGDGGGADGIGGDRGIDGGDGIRYHTLGGPLVHDVTSKRAYDASHADAPLNICPMYVTELVSHPKMSALNANA